MSKALEKKIVTCLGTISQIEVDANLTQNPNRASPALNIAEFESRLMILKDDTKLIATHLDDIRDAINHWADYLRKFTGNPTRMDAENALCEKFYKDEDVEAKMVEATEKLRVMKRLECQINLLIQIEQSRIRQTVPTPQAPAVQPEYKLPELKMPVFSGQKTQWAEWFEIFTAVVHNNPNLSDSSKLIHLRTHLAEEPKKFIEGLRVDNPANYQTAVNLLKDKFGGEVEFVQRLHLDLAGLKEAHSFAEVQHFATNVDRLTRQLANYGQNVEGTTTYLLLESKLKFAPILRQILEKRISTGASWSTTEFKKTLSELVKKEEEVKAAMNSHVSPPPVKSEKPKQRGPSTGSAGGSLTFTAISGSNQKKASINFQKIGSRSNGGSIRQGTMKPSQPICTFCNGSHSNEKCSVYDTAQKRMDRLFEARKCLKCLRSGHFASRCTWKKVKCRLCSGTHNTALCGQKQIKTEVQKPAKKVSTNATTEETLVNVSTEDKEKKSLLMCLQVTVFNPQQPHRSRQANLLLDSGSHRSFIHENLASALGLKELTQEAFVLTGFGESKGVEVHSSRVRFGLLTDGGGKLVISANKMPKITNELLCIRLTESDDEALAKQWLDLPLQPAKPSILIGMDLWYHMKIKPVLTLPSGYVLSSSVLGRFLSGEGRILGQQDKFGHHTHITATIIESSTDDIGPGIEQNDTALHKLVSDHFAAEAIGMDEAESQHDQDQRIMDEFRSNLVFHPSEDGIGRYQVGLLWNGRAQQLPTNFKLARGRLRSTLKQLKANPELLSQYESENGSGKT